MSWSLKIARVFGIPIYLHWTFLVLIAWLFFAQLNGGSTPAEAAWWLLYPLSVFGCVVLHELGHATAARRYGVPTRDITLLPIGGVARLERMPEKPAEELVVALAGPLVNVVIAGALYLAGARLPFASDDPDILVHGRFLDRLLLINVFLVLFNLVPAFPMDGGRVLRALLAMTTDYNRATQIAARIGQFLAIVFLFIGLQHNPMWILIALFVWVGAQGEAVQVAERTELAGVAVRDAMLTSFDVIRSGQSLGEAVDLLLAGSQQDFPVFDGTAYVGILTRVGLLRGLSHAGREAPVDGFVTAGGRPMNESMPLVEALASLREAGLPCAPVLSADGRPVGLLTVDNVGELLMVRAALGGRPRTTGAGAAPA